MTPPNLNSQTTKWFFLSIVIFLIYLSWKLVAPFINPIIFGGIIAGSFLPLHKKLKAVISKRIQLSCNALASLSTFLLLIIVITPATFIAIELVGEAMTVYKNLRQGASYEWFEQFFSRSGFISSIVTWIKVNLGYEISLDMLKMKVTGFAETILSFVISHFNSLVQNIFSFAFDFIIVIVSIFGFYAQGEQLKTFAFNLSPLPQEDEELILHKFNEMNYVTMYGNGLGGIIQGGLAGIAFWVVGFNSIILLTVLMIGLAFIPLLGISIVFIPATIYLWIKGEILKAILLFIFCLIVAMWVENVYKPKLMSKKVKVDSMMLLLFILGGMSQFGPIGIFYGPIILTLSLTFIDLYLKNYREHV